MKTPRPLAGWLTLLALLSTLNPQLSTALAQGTAFTYQGRLNDGTNAANGFYDLRFGLHDTSVGGHGVIGLLTNTATPVSNGLFTVTLDFGSGIFTGDAWWLGLGVRTNGGASFITLSPRQQLTATPYAILASGVGVGDITAGMLSSGAVTSDKIAADAVKGYQIDDGGSAAYEGFQTAAQTVSSDTPLPFASLYLVASTNILQPAFSLTVNGGSLGTVVGFSGSEGISRPYAYVVEVQASGAALDPDAQLGLTATLTFTRNSRTTSFGGIITACTRSGAGASGLLYTVRIEPPLASLALTTDYKVNQNLKAYQVASALYQTVTGNSATLSLAGDYSVRENLIQYAETDLNFFSRLLEYEGIFYFFNQSASPPPLILGDSPSAYLSAPNSPLIYYGDTTTNLPTGADYIRTFQKADHQSTRTSSVNAYNFQTPAASLLRTSTSSEGVGEHYEFGTPVRTTTYDQQIADTRRDRQGVERAAIAGSGTAPDLRAGYTFTLTDQTGAGLGGTYLVTDVRHAGFVRVTNGVSTLFYGNQFQVIPSSLPYRPALQTPKPQALPCTAIVTGPSGEEIYTDQYGRVKVQFHWDRYGAKDETSSAWLRQTSPMASSKWRGMMFLPRIGDEVLVSFIQGDPDQPVITGSLYHGTNMPPYNLPANKTVSTIRSTGSKGQPNQINEIKFDDLAGQQLFNLQAAKDMNITVANNLNINATNGLKITAANDLSITAGNDLTITVVSNLTIQANTQTTINGPLAASSLAIQTGSASNLTLTGNLYLPNTTAGAGAVYFGSVPVIRAFSAGNFFAGANAGNVTMSGNYNTAVGAGALDADTSGANNSAFGYGALGAATTGSENTASGVNALFHDVGGSQNAAHGAGALYSNSSGSANTANGYKALFSNTTGTNNIALGSQAGYNLTTGNNNIDIGNVGMSSDSGVIRIGTSGTHNTTLLAGNVGIGTTSPGEVLEVYGADVIMRLRNSGDSIGAFVGDTCSSLQLGLYNPTGSASGVIPANTKRSFFGLSNSGLVGSITSVYGCPTFRNLLDDGNGRLSVGVASPSHLIDVTGGAYCNGTSWVNNSDRNTKEAFTAINPRTVLEKVTALPITEWKYKAEADGSKHLGPMAQDFHAAFGLNGADDKHIATVDESGVALAAIQGLNQKVEDLKAEAQRRDAENAELKQQLAELKALVQQLAQRSAN